MKKQIHPETQGVMKGPRDRKTKRWLGELKDERAIQLANHQKNRPISTTKAGV